MKILTEIDYSPKRLVVKAGVRYWEDATVNDAEDTNGTLIPFRKNAYWCPIIDLITGCIIDWPFGTIATIHYKVCDDGDYWLEDANGKKAKYLNEYVPDSLLCVGSRGYGDYIILKVF